MDSSSGVYGNGKSTMDCVDQVVNSEGSFNDSELNRTHIPICERNLKPHVGQVFATIDAAFDFYRDYGRAGGFDVRRSCQRRFKSGIVSMKYLVCSKSGSSKNSFLGESDTDSFDSSWTSENKSAAESSKRKRKTMSFKCLCNAHIVLHHDGLKGYVVTRFIEEHSHAFATDSEKQFLRANRCMNDLHMQFVFEAGLANIGPTRAFTIFKAMCGPDWNIGATAVDFKNWARDVKTYIGKRDADIILQKFKTKRETSDNNFVYEYQTDSSGHLTRLFWADGIGRESYDLFGDVVSFDPTYRTNKYNMVFVPFIGIDNHGKTVTFAAALLDKEDVDNFKWVFEVFLKLMGRPPKCIITDQCPAMRQVIPVVFPHSIHRLCMWHIMMKFPAKIGTVFCAESDFMKKLRQFVWSDFISVSEFEEGWNSVLKEYGLEDNAWLASMFALRKSWIPAYFSDEPMIGLLRTTSRSESSNFYFSHFLQKGDTLSEFYMCFENAIEKQRYIRNKLNLEDKSIPRPATTKPIEKHAAAVYTRNIFYKVQTEIKASCNMELNGFKIEEGVRKYVIRDPPKDRSFEVDVSSDNQNVSCSCKMFTRIGYPCRHAFYCMGASGIHKIPDALLSERWKKTVVEEKVLTEKNEETSEKKEENSKDAFFEFKGCISDAGGDQDLLGFIKTEIKSLRVKVREQIENNPTKKLSMKSRKAEIAENLIGVKPSEVITVQPPHLSNNKGSRKRIVGPAERSQDGRDRPQRVCKNCDLPAFHDSRNCPAPPKEKGKKK